MINYHMARGLLSVNGTQLVLPQPDDYWLVVTQEQAFSLVVPVLWKTLLGEI